MKKTYLQPWAIAAETEYTTLICTSGVTTDNGIGYGGVDEEGDHDPAARRRRVVWDEEEEEN